MKNRSTVLLRFLVFLLPLGLFAQELPNIAPPSPEAASLGKFTEVPISHYTGLPNISVPIASYEVGGKSFPVSISYHARGIQVEEIASRVGIGWALSAGGQISRQVRDQPDDGLGGYIGISNILMDNLWKTDTLQGFFRNQTVRNDYATADTHDVHKPDRHPDQFNLQVSGLYAKFIFDYKDDSPLVQSYQDINITYGTGTNGITEFIVTDKDGFKYYFGKSKPDIHGNTRTARNYDRTMINYSIADQSGIIPSTPNIIETNYNSWLLMDVESPNGELVSFIYDEQISILYRRSYDKQESNTPNIDGTYNSPYHGQYVNYSNKIESHQFQLKEILHDGGKIEFMATDARQDLGGSKELDAVKIYDNNQVLIKSFDLHHSYPATVVDNNQNYSLKNLQTPYTDIQASKRLFLDSITEVGQNSISKPPYKFTYNGEKLPHRYSNSQDLWGYYNAKNNGDYLVFNGPDDRTIDIDKSQAGMLEKITYPTGGSTKFIYEHNRGVLGPEFAHIEIPFVNPVESRSEILTHFGNQYYITENGNSFYAKPVTLNNVFGQVRFEVTLPEINGTDHQVECIDPGNNDCGFVIKLEGINSTPHSYSGINSGVTELWSVQAGDYRLVIDPKPNMSWDSSPANAHPFEVFMSWDEQPISQNDLIYASGKRIKKIEFYDSGNNLISNKEYSYKNPVGNETGMILGMSSFITINPAFTQTNFNLYRIDASLPGRPFTTYQGNTIGYEIVTEYYGDAENNHGKTEYYFTITPDSDKFLSYPVTPPTDNEWLRGLPRNVSHYKKDSSGTYKKVKATENQYSYADLPGLIPLVYRPLSHIQDFHSDWPPPPSNLWEEGLLYEKNNTHYRLPLINMFHPYNNDGSINTNDTDYKIFHYTGGTLGTVETKEMLYDENENLTLITKTNTEFNYAKHYQPSKVISVTSDGEPVVQTFTYAQSIDAVNRTTEEQDLVDQNRLVPLEVESFKDADGDGTADLGEEISKTKTIYAWDSGVLEPLKIQTGKSTDPNSIPLVDRIDFKDYDADGNVLQVAKTNGMDITYIYGYDKTLPVAKIENATYSQVSSHVANIQNKSNLDDDNCQDSGSCDEKNLRTALNALRGAFPNAMITTYTYDPLIGVTSITDPKGYTVYYEYDDLHRLVRVKDEDGKIMSENKYHYLLDN